MDTVLLLFGILCLVLGLIGSLLPVLPGPPLSWLGLLLLQLTDTVPVDYWFLTLTAIIAIAITVLDYWIPALGTKKFGGSRFGMAGATLGLMISLVFPVLGFAGIIIWPFFGALAGELLNNASHQKAIKAALGSLVGFLTGTFLKFLLGLIYFGLFIAQVWEYRSQFFSWFY